MTLPVKDFIKDYRGTKDRVRRLELREVSAPSAPPAVGGGVTHLLNTEGGTISYSAGPNQTLKAAFEAQDPENLHDTSTGLYTVPEAGWYLLNAGIVATGARGRFYFDIPRATTGLPGPAQTVGADGDYNLSALLWIDSTGTIDIEMTFDVGGSVKVRHLGILMFTEASGGGQQYIEREGVYDTILDHWDDSQACYLTFETGSLDHISGGGFHTAISTVSDFRTAYVTPAGGDPRSNDTVSSSPSFVALEQTGVYLVTFSSFIRCTFSEDPLDGIDLEATLHVDYMERSSGFDLQLMDEHVSFTPGAQDFIMDGETTFTLFDHAPQPSVANPIFLSVRVRAVGTNAATFFADTALRMKCLQPPRLTVIRLGDS